MLVCSLRAKHGNDWAAIGTALGRSASSVKDKCRLMKDNCNSGWFAIVSVCACAHFCPSQDSFILKHVTLWKNKL